jgi:hypothetical protein
VRVDDADKEMVAALIEHADRVAKIPNLVRLTDAHVVGGRWTVPGFEDFRIEI